MDKSPAAQYAERHKRDIAAEHEAIEHYPKLLGTLADVLLILRDGGQTDGAHHKQWAIDQAVRKLTGPTYEAWVASVKDGEDGSDTYEWDEGIAP